MPRTGALTTGTPDLVWLTYWGDNGMCCAPASSRQKIGTIGIGFAAEDTDWNVNLPFRFPAEEIYAHIKKNKGDPAITKAQCLRAIRVIQDAAREELEKTP